MTRQRIAVLGAGGHAKVVLATAMAADFEVVAIHDDAEERWGETLLGQKVRGPISTLDVDDVDGAVAAIGDAEAREHLGRMLNVGWMTVVHPNASVHPSAIIGSGSVVFAGVVVQPDVRIGDHVILNTGATVDHDSDVGDFTHIAPGANLAGEVRVGKACLIGIGSVVAPGVRIGDGAVLGAGAVAMRDIGAGIVATGVPAAPCER